MRTNTTVNKMLNTVINSETNKCGNSRFNTLLKAMAKTTIKGTVAAPQRGACRIRRCCIGACPSSSRCRRASSCRPSSKLEVVGLHFVSSGHGRIVSTRRSDGLIFSIIGSKSIPTCGIAPIVRRVDNVGRVLVSPSTRVTCVPIKGRVECATAVHKNEGLGANRTRFHIFTARDGKTIARTRRFALPARGQVGGWIP